MSKVANATILHTQGSNIYFLRQISDHRNVYTRIGTILGGIEKGREHLRKCLYYVNIGNNDYIYNYYLPQFYPRYRRYNPEAFAQVLIDRYLYHIQVLTISCIYPLP